MNIVLVDNNINDLSTVANDVAALFSEMQIQTFTDPLMLAKYICNNKVDAAFLAVAMRPVDGLTLLRTLRVNKPTLPIVLILDSEAQQDAIVCEPANGHLVKPIFIKLLEDTVKQLIF